MRVLEEKQRFGQYQVRRRIGSGVSGECYEAEDTELLRKVTLKLIQPGMELDDAAKRQFAREMKPICQFDHPYLASLIQFGEIEGQLYIARRYVSSGSLLGEDGRLWFKPPLRVEDALAYAYQLAQALDYIHGQGYLHGAVTLANILALRGPNVEQNPDFAPFLLADVGQANFVRRFGHPPNAYLPLTTAPEQLGKRVLPASDQYALAVIVYFWLAGQPPFLGTRDEIEYCKLTEKIAPLTQYNPLVTPQQEAILRRALAVYPEERYPSILEFTRALQETLAPTRTFLEGGTEPETTPYVPPDVFQPLPQPIFDPPTQPITAPVPAPTPQPTPEPAPATLPQPAPEPLPVPAPEPLPQPAKEPLPIPTPEPLPQPTPEPLPGPAPETLPKPDPASPPRVESTAAAIQEQAPGAYVVIFSPRCAVPYEMSLEGEQITVGRAGASAIMLDFDTQVSRHHALLKRDGASFVLYDRRSVSGVFVNGSKISEESGYTLKHGDMIRIGNYQLIFHDRAYTANMQVEENQANGVSVAAAHGQQ